MRRKSKPIITCNKCRRVLASAKPKWKKIGDIEYYYLECIYCKTVYVISATDSELRRNIKRFQELETNVKDGNSAEKARQEAKELLKANIERSRELKEQYPLKSE